MHTMAADKLSIAYRRAVLLFSVANFAAKNANRDLLNASSSTPVSCEIVGTVGRAKASVDFAGTLEVGSPSIVNSSSAAPPCDVLAAVLAEIDPDRRAKILQKLQKAYVATSKLPVDPKLQAEAKVWLGSLKMSRPQNRVGSVSLTVTE